MKTKWDLSKAEQRAHFAHVERLKAVGAAIGLENIASSELPTLIVEQSEESVIDAGAIGGMAIAVCVRLIALKSGINICRVEIALLGCDDADIFLVDPPEGSDIYRVSGLEFESGIVLNHRILSGRPLPCNDTLEGFVVARSFASLPDQYQEGMRIDAKLRFVDQLDNSYTTDVKLSVNRHPAQVARGVRPKEYGGLFEREEAGDRSSMFAGKHPRPVAAIREPSTHIESET